MKTRTAVIVILFIAVGSFLAGHWINQGVPRSVSAEKRKILYYVDPMNPAYKSDKPGIAPGCGMPLEPVYADQGGFKPSSSMPPGTVRIPIEKQQLIGVKTLKVEEIPWTYTVKVLGRVTPDENRVCRINAAVSGWIQRVLPVTTGSQVKKDELLATFFAPDTRASVQTYIGLTKLESGGPTPPDMVPFDQPKVEEKKTPPGSLREVQQDQIRKIRDAKMNRLDTASSTPSYYKPYLRSFGISEYQIKKMEKGQSSAFDEMEIRSPIQGFVLSRNVNPELRFDRGAEFFKIADLSRVWVQVDLFENEASFFKPGTRVRMELPYQKKTLFGRVSPVLPIFDPASRTLKLRLEADNPGFIMRPDMLVNVELPVSGPAAIIVPNDAILDTGLKKTIFVDRGNGFFESREVETGRSLGDRVVITRGLMPGEKIVVSGNFLIDSESRLQQAASATSGKVSPCAFCGMNVNEDQARKAGNFWESHGRTYFFCSPEDRDAFKKNPGKYLKASRAGETLPMSMSGMTPMMRPSPE